MFALVRAGGGRVVGVEVGGPGAWPFTAVPCVCVCDGTALPAAAGQALAAAATTANRKTFFSFQSGAGRASEALEQLRLKQHLSAPD